MTKLDAALTPVEKARLDLQNGITEHTQMILDMKHRLNDLAPTAVLPPELLAEVFMYLARADFPVPRGESRLGGPSSPVKRDTPIFLPYAWLKVTHVCHHWRAVALGAPQLWSLIWVKRVDCVEEMLSRSRATPLAIRADTLQGRVDALDLVMRELPRIVSFDVKLPSHLPKREYGVQAPRLKELVLQTAETYEMLTLGTSQLQSHFNICHLPSLERLELYAFQTHWKNPLLKPTLKHLTLHGSRIPVTTTIEDVLQVLESLPLLKTLDLKSCLPHGNTAGTASRVVNLANLRQIHLHAAAPSCYQFLQHTSFPANVSMSLNFLVCTADDTQTVLSTILERLNRQGNDAEDRSPILRTLAVRTILGGSATQLRGWPTLHTVAQLTDKEAKLPDPFIDVSVRHNGTFSALALFRAVPTSAVETVLLDPVYGSKRMEKAEWVRTFEKLPNLRELGLGGWAKDHVHQVLDHRVPCEEEQSTTKKGRRRMQFCNGYLSTLYLNDLWVETYKDPFLERLKKSLAARKRAKMPLGTLVLRDCTNLVDTDADALKKIVEHVEWVPKERRLNMFGIGHDELMDDIYEEYNLGGMMADAYGLHPWFGIHDFEEGFMDTDDEEDFVW